MEPFLEAVENMTKYYIERHVDIFKQAISVPGISQLLAFNNVPDDASFHLFNKKNGDLVQLFLKNNVGGPAIIFDRFQESGTKSLTYHYNSHNVSLSRCITSHYTHKQQN